jgi:23S rRNA (guanosine2251-2'-O)-methyltransferase
MNDLLLIGRTPVREALARRDDRLEKLYLPREGTPALAELMRMAREIGVPVQFVPPQKLDALARGGHHQGAVAVLSAVLYREAAEVLDGLAADYDALLAARPLLVALDGIEDPHNVGAILRSAVAAGAAAALVPAQGTAPIGAVALKASAGTALHLPVARVHSLVRALEGAKERGYTVVGAAGEGGTAHTEVDWTGPVVLVMGSEGRGLSPAVRRACDALVRIAMPGPAESLNASVAAGVLLFEAVRQRATDDGVR